MHGEPCLRRLPTCMRFSACKAKSEGIAPADLEPKRSPDSGGASGRSNFTDAGAQKQSKVTQKKFLQSSVICGSSGQPQRAGNILIRCAENIGTSIEIGSAQHWDRIHVLSIAGFNECSLRLKKTSRSSGGSKVPLCRRSVLFVCFVLCSRSKNQVPSEKDAPATLMLLSWITIGRVRHQKAIVIKDNHFKVRKETSVDSSAECLHVGPISCV
jgi:hypothetical protein